MKDIEIKKPETFVSGFCCGERGIRTPGPVTVNSFQDCRIRPLCHFSNKSRTQLLIASANIECFFIPANLLRIKINKNETFFLTISFRNNYASKKTNRLHILLFLVHNQSFPLV